MKSKLRTLSLVLAGMISLVSSTAVADIYYTPTLHSEYQAVTGDYPEGDAAWPASGSAYPVQLLGVVINNPINMLDYSAFYIDPDDPTEAVEWQVYIQALSAGEYGGYTVEAGDYGGTALYMRANNPWYAGAPVYTEETWESEMERLNYPIDINTGEYVETSLQAGDVVLIQANAPGRFYNGKYNVNEQHSADPSKNFFITILERGVAPVVQDITLADLKSTAEPTYDEFLFDSVRATGCEHYQASLVHLDGLQYLSGEWEPDGTVIVQQTVEEGGELHTLTFDLKLGLDADLFQSWIVDAVQSNPFDITAILDQEDNSSPYTDGYRLWLTSASDLTVVPEPSAMALLIAGGLAALLIWRRRS